MRSFYFRPGKTAGMALLLAALALFVGWIWFSEGGFIFLAFSALAAAGAAKLASDAMSSEAALKFDHHSIWVRKTWGGFDEVAWRDVHDITAKVLSMRYMGIIPMGQTAYITVTCAGGALGTRRLRVSATAMGLSAIETAELVAALRKAHVDAVGVAGAAMAAADSHGWGAAPSKPLEEAASDGNFDPDAAIARYLATKQAAQAAPAPHPALRQRPTFGRRVS